MSDTWITEAAEAEDESDVSLTAHRALSLSSPAHLRVTQVSTWRTRCGIADYSGHLTSSLEQQGVACDVAVVDRTQVNYMSVGELRRHYFQLAATLAGRGPVHIQHEFAFFGGHLGMGVSIETFGYFLRHLRNRGVPVVVTFHTNPVFLRWGGGGAKRRAAGAYYRALWRMRVAEHFRGASPMRAVVHSKTTRLAFIQSGFAEASLTVLPHAAPVVREDPEGAQEVRAELGIPEGATVLGLFGFMSQYKGYDTALAAMRRLPDAVHLLLLGGPHPFSAESAIESVLKTTQRYKKLRERVHIVGFVPPHRLDAFHSAVDICIAPYDPGDLSASGALMWDLASGRPVVATKIPAFTELNDQYDCMLLVSPRSPRELAFRITELIADEGLRRSLASNALSYCRGRGWPEHARACIELYDSMSPRR